jgi:hypothetical protein
VHPKRDGASELVGMHANIAAQPLRLVVRQYRAQAFLQMATPRANEAQFQPQLVRVTLLV